MSRLGKPRHAVYLLPNAFTTAALFAGFFAILQANAGQWEAAAWAILAAAVLDACDGRVARWTNTQSSFGAEYDSLADVISFGVAPALLMYEWKLEILGKFGLVAAFCYCAATALRLARFNIQVGDADRRFFIGFPSPAAALLAAAFVATANTVIGAELFTAWLTAVVAIVLALTMISGVLYYSFKDFNLKKRVPFRYLALFLLVVALVYQFADNFMALLLTILVLYFLSGYAYAIWKFFARRRTVPME